MVLLPLSALLSRLALPTQLPLLWAALPGTPAGPGASAASPPQGARIRPRPPRSAPRVSGPGSGTRPRPAAPAARPVDLPAPWRRPVVGESFRRAGEAIVLVVAVPDAVLKPLVLRARGWAGSAGTAAGRGLRATRAEVERPRWNRAPVFGLLVVFGGRPVFVVVRVAKRSVGHAGRAVAAVQHRRWCWCRSGGLKASRYGHARAPARPRAAAGNESVPPSGRGGAHVDGARRAGRRQRWPLC